MATQVRMWAKDGDLKNGVEHATKIFHMRGNANSMPWSSAPCTEKVTPNGGVATDTPAAETSKPQVILLRLARRDDEDDDYFFTLTHQRIIGFLASVARIKTAFTAGEVLEYINNDRPQAIIVLDETLTVTDPTHGNVHPATGLVMDKIKKYVSDGGRAIFGGSFNSAKFTAVGSFWRDHFNRPWVWQAYQRSVIHYQPAALDHFPPNNFLKKYYSTKANFLRLVDPSEALYKDPDNDNDAGDDLTAVAYGKFGEGHIGWVGDVNHDLAFDDCVFAMCGFSKLDAKLDTQYPDTSLSMSLGANGFGFNK